MGLARRSFLLSIVLIGLAAAPAAADVSLALKTTGVGATVQLTPTGQFTGCNSSGYCFYHFPNGSIVTLKASPSTPASSFVRWLGACAGAGTSCSIRLDSNRSTVARFSPVQLFADEVRGKGSASGSPVGTSCGFGCWEYSYGTVVTVTAYAAPDWAFSSWSGVCAGVTVPGCRFTMFGSAETSPGFRCTSDVCSTTQPIVREVKTTVHVRGSGGYVTVKYPVEFSP